MGPELMAATEVGLRLNSVLEVTSLALALAGGCRPADREVAPGGAPIELSLPGLPECDADGDGYAAPRCAGPSPADCDDRDPAAHPGAAEELDGADDDCDGEVDEGTAAWDADGDCVCVTAPCTGSSAAGCP